LNDEDEFKISLDYNPSPQTERLLSEAVARLRTTSYSPPDLSASLAVRNGSLAVITAPIIEGVVAQCRNTVGIASFSIVKGDHHLWSEYGGKGNGAYVEIDVPGHLIGKIYYPVQYVSEKIFHIDSFLESAINPDKAFATYRNILLTKTRKWSQEAEIRFIGKHQGVSFTFDGRVTEVAFGPSVPKDTLERLTAGIYNHCAANNIRIWVEHPS
jgi:hypothetical protein